MQAQAYWILSNSKLYSSTKKQKYLEYCRNSADRLLVLQRDDGAYDNPDPEWAGLHVPVQGCFATIAFLEVYNLTKNKVYLEAAIKYYNFIEESDWIVHEGYELIRYFIGEDTVRYIKPGNISKIVPNNQTLLVFMYSYFYKVTGEKHYLDRVPSLINYLESVIDDIAKECETLDKSVIAIV